MEPKMPAAFAGIDIGGTLAKFCLWIPTPEDTAIETKEELCISLKRGKIVFCRKDANSHFQEFIEIIKKYQKEYNLNKLSVTGGGAYKFYDKLQKELEIEIVRQDEMETLYKGLNFLVNYVDDFSFSFCQFAGKSFFKTKEKYPFLLVNIGSGVSILKFAEDGKYERVTGTCLGGGTFMGLSKLILGESDFEKLLQLALKGKSENVDLLIKDIFFAQDSPARKLSETIENLEDGSPVAVSLGKVPRLDKDFTHHVEKKEPLK